MYRMLATMLGLSLCVTTFADDTASIEFQERARALGQSISSDNARQSERCTTLRRQMDASRGMPQRSSTARQAFEAECVGDYSAPASPGLSIGN